MMLGLPDRRADSEKRDGILRPISRWTVRFAPRPVETSQLPNALISAHFKFV